MATVIRDINQNSSCIGSAQALIDSDFLGLVQIKERIIVWANAALHATFGFNKDELHGKPIRVFFQDDARYKVFERAVYQQIEDGKPFRDDIQLRRKDGSLGWFQINLSSTQDQTDLLVGAILDISTRHTRQEEQEARLAEVFRSAMDGIVSIDAAHRIVMFNPAAELLFQRKASEMLGQPLDTLLPNQYRAAHRQHIQTFAPSGTTIRRMGTLGCIQGLRADGQELILEASICRSHSSSGAMYTVFLRDITERKRAEEQLRQRERLLNQELEEMRRLHHLSSLTTGAGELSQVLSAILDTAIAFTRADFGTIQMLDVVTGELGMVGHRGFPPEWIDQGHHLKVRRSCEMAFRQGKREIVEDIDTSPLYDGDLELDAQRKAGIRAMQSTPLISREGQVLGVFSTYSRVPHRPGERELRLLDLLARQAADIIDGLRNDIELRRSEAQLRQFIEYAPVALAMFDPEMRYLAVSRRWLADYRLDNDVIGCSHYDIFPELSDEWKAVHQRGLAGEVVQENEARFARMNGSNQWLRWEVRPWYTREGSIGGILIFTEDVTERKLAEKAVQSSQGQLEAALESMSDAVCISDATGRFVHFNKAFAAFYGFKTKNECARSLQAYPSFLDVYTDQNRLVSFSEWVMSRALRGETAVGAEYTLHRQDTGDTWIGSFNFAPIRDETGSISGSVVTSRDITKEKNAEQALLASQAQIRAYAQHLDAAIESERVHLAREIHDVLGQLLTALRLDVSSVRCGLKSPVTETVLKNLDVRLGEAISITDEIIQTVRRFAGELRPVVLELMGLDQAIKLQCRNFTKRTGIPCVTRNVLAVTLADDRALAAYRTFQEALTNIARHDPKAKQVMVSLTTDEDQFTLEVINLGRTISEAEAFNPNAFGLIGMRERAIALSGRCTIEGWRERGTRVCLEAPLNENKPAVLHHDET